MCVCACSYACVNTYVRELIAMTTAVKTRAQACWRGSRGINAVSCNCSSVKWPTVIRVCECGCVCVWMCVSLYVCVYVCDCVCGCVCVDLLDVFGCVWMKFHEE